VFAYICSIVYAHKSPVNEKTVKQRMSMQNKRKLVRDSNMNLVWKDDFQPAKRI